MFSYCEQRRMLALIIQRVNNQWMLVTLDCKFALFAMLSNFKMKIKGNLIPKSLDVVLMLKSIYAKFKQVDYKYCIVTWFLSHRDR